MAARTSTSCPATSPGGGWAAWSPPAVVAMHRRW